MQFFAPCAELGKYKGYYPLSGAYRKHKILPLPPPKGDFSFLINSFLINGTCGNYTPGIPFWKLIRKIVCLTLVF